MLKIDELIKRARETELNGFEQSRTDAIATELRILFRENGIPELNLDHLHGAMIALQAALIASPKAATIGEEAQGLVLSCTGFVIAAMVQLEVTE
jgi:hypothetical protein